MSTSVAVQIRRFLWAPLRLEVRRQARRWERAVHQAREVQARLLERLVAQAAETEFGRAHGLDRVRTIQDFRGALPVAGYERAEPWIERVRHGETRALFAPGTRIHMFALTSGTTGTPKHIPVTDALLKAYRQGWHIWASRAMSDHYEAFGARILQIVSRMDEKTTPAGIPVGAMSGLTASAQRRAVQWTYVTPLEAAYASDAATKYYLACRLGLHARRVMPITPNPSTLLGLARLMDERKEELLRDLTDGTLTQRIGLEGEARRRIEARLAPCPRRARELEAAVARSGHLYPKDAWDLPLIGTWKGGTLSLYLREMPRYWGDAPVRDIGLIASEGRFSIPLHTEGSAGVLEVMSTFYEFVPEAQAEQDDPPTLLAHETEVGQRYFLVLTTPGGLFRYNIGDLVEVVERLGSAPVIAFLNKGSHVSSLTGEKITEFQVTTATSDTIERLGLGVRNYCLCPTWGTVPYYSLLVEENEITPLAGPRLASMVDNALCDLNTEYEAKRKSGRLGPVRVKTIPRGTWHAYDAEEIEAGSGRAEQYKHKFLASDVDFERRFAVRECYAPAEEETGRGALALEGSGL